MFHTGDENYVRFSLESKLDPISVRADMFNKSEVSSRTDRTRCKIPTTTWDEIKIKIIQLIVCRTKGLGQSFLE